MLQEKGTPCPSLMSGGKWTTGEPCYALAVFLKSPWSFLWKVMKSESNDLLPGLRAAVKSRRFCRIRSSDFI